MSADLVPGYAALQLALDALGDLVTHEYRLKCQHCRYGRRTGNAPTLVGIKAAKHAATKPGHTVRIYDHDVPLRDVIFQRQELTDDPPF